MIFGYSSRVEVTGDAPFPWRAPSDLMTVTIDDVLKLGPRQRVRFSASNSDFDLTDNVWMCGLIALSLSVRVF